MRKVMIFIDGSNTFRSMQRFAKEIDQENYRVDFEKLISFLKGGNDLIRTYYFASSRVPPIEEQTRFHEKLKKELRFEIHIFPLIHEKEKGVDVSMAVNFLAYGLNDAYDEGILLTGDKDLCTAVKFVKQKGKYVKVVAFKNSLAKDLEELADECILLDYIYDQISLK